MATQRKQFNPDQPEAADKERRRDQPVADAPATVPHPGEGIEPSGSQPPEDGGVEVRAYVYTEREAAAARLMPVKKPPDTGKWLLCPMPGLVRSIEVNEGQEVKAGETLAVVEAMKMENVLRAERDATVKAIKVKPGDSLAVDAVIMEFA